MSPADQKQIPREDWLLCEWLVASGVRGWDADVMMPWILGIINDNIVRMTANRPPPKLEFSSLFPAHSFIEMRREKDDGPDPDEQMRMFDALAGKTTE